MPPTALKDLENRTDVETLIDAFYVKAISDEIIGPMFTEVVQLNWEHHIPTINDFWESLLFDKMIYKGNPMIKHIELNRKSKLSPQHFERWLGLWEETVGECFIGPTAEKAIEKAKSIGKLMKFKVEQSNILK